MISGRRGALFAPLETAMEGAARPKKVPSGAPQEPRRSSRGLMLKLKALAQINARPS